MSCGKLQAISVCCCESLILFVRTAPPDGTHGMDHKTRLQSSSPCDHSFSWRTSTLPGNYFPAFIQELRSRRTVYGTIHATPAQQARVCSVNDCIHILRRYVSEDEGQCCRRKLSCDGHIGGCR